MGIAGNKQYIRKIRKFFINSLLTSLKNEYNIYVG